MKKTLAACLNLNLKEVNPPKTNLLDLEIIGGRSVISYSPKNYNGIIPQFFLDRIGHELGAGADIHWISNIFLKGGIIYTSGFIPEIRGGGLIEPRDIYIDSSAANLRVDRIINDPRFLITSHTSAHAFYHFMIDYLPRFRVMEKSKKPCLPFLFSPYRTGFQYQAMDILLNRIYPIHSMNGGVLLRECAIMSAVSKVEAVDFLRERSAHIAADNSRKRIYISRRYASYRRVVNEDELEPILSKFGFQIIECENMNLEKQISVFKSAEFICAPHGAGLTNIAYCNKNASVLEIIMPERFPLAALFWELACAAEIDYHILEGKRIAINSDATDGDIYVEPKKLELALEHMTRSSV